MEEIIANLTPKSPLHYIERGLKTGVHVVPPLYAVERGLGGEVRRTILKTAVL